jgi:ribosomal protein S18 acetylase RimI-like enzyme
MYYELSLKADVCKIYGVDKYIYATGLSVAPAYRGQKLGQRLLEVRQVYTCNRLKLV